MPQIRGSELLVLVLLIVLLFGAKRLPEAARGVGRSLRIFKAETKGLTESADPSPSAALDQDRMDQDRMDQDRLDQGQGSVDPATGIDAATQTSAGQEVPKPPTSQA